MARRAVSIAAALLLCACSVGPFGSSTPTTFGIIVVTAGRSVLRGGADDVPPRLNLRIHAQTALQSGEVSVSLDRRPLPVTSQAGDALAQLAQPLALGSPHHLDIAVVGRADHLVFDFSVIPPTAAMFAAHRDAGGGFVVDGVFADSPDHTALTALLPGATLTWSDPSHVRLTWAGARPAAIDLPPTLTTDQGSHLAAQLHLSLAPLGSAELRRTTVPPAAAIKPVPLLAFASDTAASNSSAAHHLNALNAVSPTGWSAAADGTLLGNPDPVVVQRAAGLGIPVWPLVANDPADSAATSRLLRSPDAVGRLVYSVSQSTANGGFAGVHLDFEGVDGADKDALTALVTALASALHKVGAKLAVDIVPHGASGTNTFSAAYDVKAIGQAADLVDVMTYDEHGEGGTPGPVAGLDWQRAELTATLPDLVPSRTLLGIPFYARTWDAAGGRSQSYGEALASALAEPGAHVDYDFAAQTPFIRSGDGSSITYYDDADSLLRKLALVGADGLAGAAAWRLGYEDPAFWSLAG